MEMFYANIVYVGAVPSELEFVQFKWSSSTFEINRLSAGLWQRVFNITLSSCFGFIEAS